MQKLLTEVGKGYTTHIDMELMTMQVYIHVYARKGAYNDYNLLW